MLEIIVEEGTPEAAKKFFKKEKFIDKIVDTTYVEHSAVFLETIEELGMRNEKGRIDYSGFDNQETREKAADIMAEKYLQKAVKSLGASAPETEVEKDIILQRYFGITRDTIGQLLDDRGSDYTLKQHEKVRDKHIEGLNKELRPIAQSHIKKEHIEDLVGYVKAKDILDTEKLKVNPEALGDILRVYEANKGQLPYNAVAGTGLVKDTYKKKQVVKKAA